MANTTYSYVKKFELDDTILPDVWCIVRLDGRGFSNFTRIHNFRKPNEPRGLALMNAAAAYTMSVFQDLVLGYGHSDEYSFLLKLDSNLYNRRREKLLSAITSVFSSAYCIYWPKFFDSPLKSVPSFDGRVVLYPTFRHVKDYYSWRHADCHINNQYNSCFWCLVSKGKSENEAYTWLKGTQKGEKNEYMFQECGLNYNSMPSIFRKGSTLVRVAESNDAVGPLNSFEFDDKETISLFIKANEIDHWSQVTSNIASPFKVKVLHINTISQSFWDVFNENNIVLDDAGLCKLSSAECMV